MAFFIADTVAALDLQAFHAAYEGDGRRNRPFDPQMMFTVLLYAYATGTFSLRRIAKKLEEDVAYRVIAAGNFPAHRTIADLRQQHFRRRARSARSPRSAPVHRPSRRGDYCRTQDQAGVPGYLETDRPENVEFYRRFGFEVTSTRTVLDVPNYFMSRSDRRGS